MGSIPLELSKNPAVTLQYLEYIWDVKNFQKTKLDSCSTSAVTLMKKWGILR
jgi:hypothetical protein